MAMSDESLNAALQNAGLAEPGQTSAEYAEGAAGETGETTADETPYDNTVTGVRDYLDEAGDDQDELRRRVGVVQAAEDQRDEPRAGVLDAIERANTRLAG
jgi:hypothetical protein